MATVVITKQLWWRQHPNDIVSNISVDDFWRISLLHFYFKMLYTSIWFNLSIHLFNLYSRAHVCTILVLYIYKSFIRHYDSKLNKNRIIYNNKGVCPSLYLSPVETRSMWHGHHWLENCSLRSRCSRCIFEDRNDIVQVPYLIVCGFIWVSRLLI